MSAVIPRSISLTENTASWLHRRTSHAAARLMPAPGEEAGKGHHSFRRGGRASPLHVVRQARSDSLQKRVSLGRYQCSTVCLGLWAGMQRMEHVQSKTGDCRGSLRVGGKWMYA